MFDDRIISKSLWPVFKPQLHRLAQQTKPYAMVSRNRMQNLHRLWLRVQKQAIPGDVVECGVARGGSALLVAIPALASDPDRHVWLYDAFELIQPTVARLEEVQATFYETFQLPRERVTLIKGLFEDVVGSHPDRPIAYLHIDTGVYEGTKACLESLYPKLSGGGWLIFDNYGRKEGCRAAADEYLAAVGVNDRLQRHSTTQAYLQKPA